PSQLAQRRLEILAARLELLDVLDRLRVLILRQRIHRSQLLAPPGETFDPRRKRPRLLLLQWLGAAVLAALLELWKHELEPAGDLRELISGLRDPVAHTLRRDLRFRDGLRAAPELRLDLRLLAGTRA